MSPFNVGDVVWVDEGDGHGCVEYRGKIEEILPTGELKIRVNSHPIGAGAATGELRYAHPDLVYEVESSKK